MPLANYNWLMVNPAFESIPKGYVIHHLDHDKLNDDPTNLVLMQKHHHSAYHWKQKKIDTEVKISVVGYNVERTSYSPTTKPVVKKRTDVKKPWYFLTFREKIEGESVFTIASKDFSGNRFYTRQEAEQFKKVISG